MKKEHENELFPPEVITEILSWLPMKSLGKIQLVSKQWKALIHNRYFHVKLMDHGQVTQYFFRSTEGFIFYKARTKPHKEPFRYVDGCEGLLLVWSDSFSKHLIWNPTTRRFLELPDAHKYSYGFVFSYVTATRNYKLVSIYNDKELGVACCEIFVPGQSKVWRRCPTFPDINVKDNFDGEEKLERVSVVLSGEVVYCIFYINIGRYNLFEHIVVSLNLENECCTIITPLPNISFKNWQKVWAIDWNGKLAFSEIVGQNLQVMVLEDNKNHKWCENKKIIPLLPVMNCKIGSLFPLFAKQGDIWFCLKEYQNVFTYTIISGICTYIMHSKTFPLDHKLYVCKQSLVSLEGMISDTKFEEKRKLCHRTSPLPFYRAIYFACLAAIPICIEKFC